MSVLPATTSRKVYNRTFTALAGQVVLDEADEL
jgi:hypothetical protein